MGFSVRGQIARDCLTNAAAVTSGSASGLIVLQCIGQSSVIGNFNSERLTLRQGFLQPQLDAKVTDVNYSLFVEVYPNPFIRNIFLNFNECDEENASIDIYSLTGVLLKSFEKNMIGNVEIDLSQLKPGMYLLKLDSPNGRFVNKIQKL